ncbi:MAG: PilZ domain-containing protein [Myxococcota bacterium]|nr:PilZ domain-containing protein [Myxococcota bacterium]
MSDLSEAEGRRSTRYLIRVPVQVGFGEHMLALQSQNVSFNGIFIRCGALPKVGTEVSVRIRLPFGFGDVVLVGTVIHVILPSNAVGRVPGMGIGWSEGQDATLERWRGFVERLVRCYESLETAAMVKLVDDIGVDARYNVRREFALKVRFRDVDSLSAVYTRDVSVGGIFLMTEEEFSIGQLLELDVVHPRTGSSFPVRGAIRWRGRKGEGTGVGIELIEMDEDQRDAFWKFVSEGDIEPRR